MSHEKHNGKENDIVKRIHALSREMQAGMQTSGRFRSWFNRIFHNKPRNEIFHDWHLVMSFYLRVVETMETANGRENPEKPEKHARLDKTENGDRIVNLSDEQREEKIANLALIDAYLELSRHERNFARAWTFINLATTLLALVVEPKDRDAVTFRMVRRYQKDQLQKEYTKQKSKLTAVKSQLELLKSEKRQEAFKEALENATPLLAEIGEDLEKLFSRFSEQLPAPETDADRNNPHFLYARQLCQTQEWNTKNMGVSLRLSLWRFIGGWLALALAGVVALAVLSDRWFISGTIKPWYYAVMIALGFFGGGLSAFVTSRQTVVNIPNSRIIKAHTLLRMLMGAAGAFVIFPIVQWLPLGDISAKIINSLPVFLTLGVVAGFSERLFINALEKIADNLSTGVEEKMKTESRETVAEKQA